MASRFRGDHFHGWGWVMAYGIAMVLLALVAFAWPFSATMATTFIAGTLLVIAAAVALAAAARHHGERRLYDVIGGVLALVVGLYLLFRPVSGAISLTMALAAFFGARGVLELYWGFKRAKRRGWVILLGLINLALMALIVLTLPGSALTLPGTLMAVSFLFTGVAAIGAALELRKGERG